MTNLLKKIVYATILYVIFTSLLKYFSLNPFYYKLATKVVSVFVRVRGLR